MTKTSPWLSTAAACQRLGVSRWVLATARKNGDLKKGHHWKVKNPTAARLTYLWHCDRLEKWQSTVQTKDVDTEFLANFRLEIPSPYVVNAVDEPSIWDTEL